MRKLNIYTINHNRKKSSRRNKLVHMIDVEDPHPSSMASKLLLSYELRHQDKYFLEKHDWEGWLKVKYKFVKEYEEKYGQLRCMYCNRKLFYGPKKNNLTIDHFLPAPRVSYLDDRFFILSCSRCNSIKGENLVPVSHLRFAPRSFKEELSKNIKKLGKI